MSQPQSLQPRVRRVDPDTMTGTSFSHQGTTNNLGATVATSSTNNNSTFLTRSARIVVVGVEGSTSALLGTTPTTFDPAHASLTGRTAVWNQAGQCLGVGDIVVAERTVNCPTSTVHRLAPAASAAAQQQQQQTSKIGDALGGADPTSSQQFVASGAAASETPIRSSATMQDKSEDSQQQQQQQTERSKTATGAHLILAKSTTLPNAFPSFGVEFFEISDAEVKLLGSDQLFGPYVLNSSTACVILVVDAAALFPAPPSTGLLIDTVESAAAANKKKRIARDKEESAARGDGEISSAFMTVTSSTTSRGEKTSSSSAAAAAASLAASLAADSPEAVRADEPLIATVLQSYRERQDAVAERYVESTAERIKTLRQALDKWTGQGSSSGSGPVAASLKSSSGIPLMVAVHNTEAVAPRLEAWSATSAWAALSDTQRTRVLDRMPKRSIAQGTFDKAPRIPSLHSCCAAEPFVQSHITLHRTYPQVGGTIATIRKALTAIAARTNNVPFYVSLTSAYDCTPVALLSSVVSRPHVFGNAAHLQEIVHTFKSRCHFRRVFVLEPRTGSAIAADRPWPRYVMGVARDSRIAQEPGNEPSFSAAQTFIHDYLSVADACRVSSALSAIVSDDIEADSALIKASYDKVEQGEILNVAEGGLSAFRGSLELSNGEGVFLYGLAPPVGLVLGCIGDCVEVQRMQSLIEFNLHVVQTTSAGLFDEALKRARAAGYVA